MSVKVNIEIETVNLYSGRVSTHLLTINVSEDVVKNKSRLLSHCTSVTRKSYGRNAKILHIKREDTGEVYA